MKCTTPHISRPVQLWPPKEDLPQFPPCEFTSPTEFPGIMVQWHWGVMVYWNNEEQCFYTNKVLPPDFRIAETDGPMQSLRIDGFDFDLKRNDLAWGWMWAQSAGNNRSEIFRQMTENDPADDLNFWLSDYDIPDLDAASRAFYVVNTPGQLRLKRPQIYQVATIDGYREVFDNWKQAGFVGAIVQKTTDAFNDTRFLSDLWVKSST